jgi:hypothetical protein
MSYILGSQALNDTILQCINCEKPLVTVTLMSKEFDYNWILQADCPFCGDSSEPLEMKGKFCYNGIDPVKIVATPLNKINDIFEMRFKTK